MYLGELRCTIKNTSGRVSGPPAPVELDTLPQRVARPPVPPINNRLVYDGPLLAKYKMTDFGYYSSTTTGSVFENMLGFIPGGIFEAVEAWKTPKFSGAREIHERLRKEYRKSSGGHSGYTFHTLTYDEIQTIHNSLFS